MFLYNKKYNIYWGVKSRYGRDFLPTVSTLFSSTFPARLDSPFLIIAEKNYLCCANQCNKKEKNEERSNFTSSSDMEDRFSY
jgi:hypothetical protein